MGLSALLNDLQKLNITTIVFIYFCSTLLRIVLTLTLINPYFLASSNIGPQSFFYIHVLECLMLIESNVEYISKSSSFYEKTGKINYLVIHILNIVGFTKF